MFASLPVIATRAGGIPEGIMNNETGYLVEVDDYVTLAKKIKYLVDHDEIRKKMGMKGRWFAESKFSIDSWIGKYHQYFNSLIRK
jgi:glycosyltransferase involved in cell wall biosynthesis